MRVFRTVLSGLGAITLVSVLAWPQTQPPVIQKPLGSVPLVLSGGTVVDVTDWGHSARDLGNAIVIVRDGRITEVGAAGAISIPKGARVIDCSGKFIIPGLVDGFAGMNSQGQANANLYMGVTTVVASSDDQRGVIDVSAHPSPHLYLIDSIGTTDNWSFLASRPEWASKLKDGAHPVELSPEDTLRQMNDTAKLGTRVLWLGWNLTAANTQWIIAHAHQMGLVTYGEFVSTPYSVGIEAGVDMLLHMNRYELGVIPDELQRPLVDNSEGPAANTAYDYAERLPPTDPHLRAYAHLIATHHAALMPTFSLFYLHLTGHRNLWTEPAARLLDPSQMYQPSDRATGEVIYPLPPWTRRIPAAAQRWMEDSQRKKADQSALGCGAPIKPSSPHSRTTWRVQVPRPRGPWPASPCTLSLNCLSASGSPRAKPWPPPPTTIPSSLAGMSLARLPLAAAPTSWSSMAIRLRISGTLAVSAGSLLMAMSWIAMRC
jgi:hypothetical protein